MGTVPQSQGGGFSSREEALAFSRLLGKAINAHDISTLVSFYAEDAVMVSPIFHQVSGRDAIAKNWEVIFSTYPDWSVRQEDVLVDGNRLAIMGTVAATDQKGWFGLPPTGGMIVYHAVVVLTFAGGKIVRDERLYDNSAVLEHLEKIRLDNELTTAADVQRALLSRTARSGSYYEIAGDSIASRTIGGDFFEFAELPRGGIGIALGDVAGKGPAAALLAAMLQGMFVFEAQAGSQPAAALTSMNRAVAERGLGWRMATLAYGVLSPDGRFIYSNAGHSPPILLKGAEAHRLVCGGPILGALGDAKFPEETLQLNKGDIIILCSDGITEARNEKEEEFGEARFIERAKELRDAPSTKIAEGILAAARDFSRGKAPNDDMTVTVTRYL